MLFNSLSFAVFFLVVFGLYKLIPGWSAKKNLLLVSSYVFYGAWNPPFALLLFGSTVIDWLLAGRMAQETEKTKRKLWLTISLIANFGCLGFFKYGNFLLENYGALRHLEHAPHFDIILPVGISFYTFHTLSYTIDVYRGELKPVKSLRDFALFVAFFPQLVAGPIVRARNFLFQLEAEPAPAPGRFSWGLFLMTIGLFQKMVVADTLLAPTADNVFGHPFPLAALDAWLGAVAFGMQIFCDFSGYSLTAIGLDLCFGFQLLDNFRFPYAAVGFSDFWRRWHISLSTWLRDYLYIPLGGNRRGTARNLANLMIVMLLGGLWHGAAWTFVLWGGLHGLFLVLERGVRWLFGKAAWFASAPAAFVGWLLTFLGVTLAWVFFRAPDAGAAMTKVMGMTGFFGLVAPAGDRVIAGRDIILVTGTVALILLVHWRLRNSSLEAAAARMPAWVLTGLWIAMSLAILLAQGSGNAFIYFQF